MGAPRLGGSAFNALRTLKAISPDFRLGMIGVIGNTPAAEGFRNWFGENRIDTPFVTLCADLPPGGCLAMKRGGERTLITTRGANDRLCKTLRSHPQAVADWVAQARIVHLSSFLDPDSPALLTELLASCRDRNPELEISIDPGAHWTSEYRSNACVRRLLDMATLLFVNQEEFDLIHGSGLASPESCAARIALAPRPPHARTLLKQPDRLILFDAAGKVLSAPVHAQLAPEEILDSTGAGDVLAGAYLAALIRQHRSAQVNLVSAQTVVAAMLRRGWAQEKDFKSIFDRAFGVSN
jgi:sugar/nucleoside kinase (ribokinase family)